MKHTDCSFLKTYLESREVRYTEDGQYLRLDWQNGSDTPGFSTGWAIITDKPDQALLTFDIPHDADYAIIGQIWDEVMFYYLAEVSLVTISGNIALASEIRLDKVNSIEKMDSIISKMTEAILSLMSRYEDKTHPATKLFTNKSRCQFIENNLTKWATPSLFHDEMNFIEDEVSINDFASQQMKKFSLNFQKPKSSSLMGKKGFAAVAGMDSLKEEMEEKVLWMLTHKEIAALYKLEQPSGMLLYGPPGCGKTYFAERFAEESGMKYMLVKPSDLADRYIHGSQQLISEMFEKASKNSPCVICFDEFDALVPKRDSREAESRAGEVNEFLTQMNNAGARGIFIIGTTNNREAIDPAILRSGRLDIHVEVKAPDAESRKALFRFHLAGRPLDKEIDYDAIASKTEGYSCSDIVSIVRTAAIKAARSEALIGNSHLLDAILATKPSIDPHKSVRKLGFMTGLQAIA